MSSSPDNLLAQHARQRAALDALRACIAALGEIAPPALVAQEMELVAALAVTEAMLQSSGVTQLRTGDGDVVGQEGDRSQGAFVNGGTFYGTVIGYQENQTSPVSPWACYQCGVDNPPNTSFCFKCSAQLLRVCPECKKNTSMVVSGICVYCGYHVDIAMKRNNLRDQIEYQIKHLNIIQSQYDQLMKVKDDKSDIGCITLLVLLSFYGVCAANDDIAVRVLMAFIFLITAVTIRLIATNRRKRVESSKSEMSIKIRHLEQSIIQCQIDLNETNIKQI